MFSAKERWNMKRCMKIIIALAVVFMFASASFGCQSNVGKPLSNTNHGVEIKTFGRYAQNLVTDEALIENLKTAPEDNDGRITYGDGQYEKITATPYRTGLKFSDGTKIETGKEYFFEVAPVTWYALDSSNGKTLLFAEKILDVSLFSDKTEMEGCGFGFYYTGKDYPNDWSCSKLREFMNGKMFDSLFDEVEAKGGVVTTRVSSAYPESYFKAHSSQIPVVSDKVFAPSYKELVTAEYGFTEDGENYDCLRMAEPTDYALAKGCKIFESNAKEGYTDYERDSVLNRNGDYWLRTVGHDIYYAGICRYTGAVGKYYAYVNNASQNKQSEFIGVRPAVTVQIAL